ncbi:MAG: DUF4160 domain-containing protein [Planctomycetota bacterium]|nr:DUF4160 domain-containing protein [Planctomycetota bacterium]
MPVVLRKRGYRFMFYSSDAAEPPHVHVKKGRKAAKFWLVPVVDLESNRGFRPHELNEIERIIVEEIEYLLESWNAFFGR